jgi:carnitine 3-dehydrogenase
LRRGAATVTDIDAVITNGPGLRWAVVCPFASQHLSGGSGGIAHTIEHLGPPMVEWWQDLWTPDLTEQLRSTVVKQMRVEMGSTSPARLVTVRDRLLSGLIAAKSAESELTT